MPDHWLVYCYYRNGVPVYVGQGKPGRQHQHARGLSGNPRLKALIAKHPEQVTYDVLAEGLSQNEAIAQECALISAFGRVETGGTLFNRTDGGEGVKNPSAETRQKLRELATGVVFSEERRRKISEAQIGSQRNLGKRHTEETKERIRQKITGRKMPDWFSDSVSVRMRGNKYRLGQSPTPEHHAKMCAASKEKLVGNTFWLGRTHTPEVRERLRQANLGNTHSKGAKWSEQRRERFNAAIAARKARRACTQK